MKKTITSLVDDLDGSDAAETISFALDGKAYEIDLSEKNASKLRAVVAPYAGHARTAGRRPRARSVLPTAGHSRSAEIRAWAASQGLNVPSRGRIPSAIVTQFETSQ